MSGRARTTVVVALLVAVALRAPFAGTQSLWFDETFTASIATLPSLGDLWPALRATEATPPLSYLLSWLAVQLLGDTDVALRLPSLAAGILTVPAAFAAVRRFASDRVAVAVAALVATSPMLVSYAVEARSYALFVLLGTLSVWALGRALADPRPRAALALWVLTAAAAVWTHYFAAFLVAAEALVLLWRLPGARARVLGAWAAVAVLVVPLVPLVLDQRDGRTAFIGDRSLLSHAEQATRQFALGPNVPTAWLEGLGIALILAGLLVGAVVVARGDEAGPRLLLLVLVAFVALPVALALTGVDRSVNTRNLLVAWPLVAAVVAIGLLRLHVAAIAALCVLGTVTTVWAGTDWRLQRSDWRTVAPAVLRLAGEAPIVVEPGLEGRAADRYLGRRPLPGPVTTRDLWVVIAPERRDSRDLEPGRTAPPDGVPPGFALAGQRALQHGFTVRHLQAASPVPVDVAALGPDVRGEAPAVFVPE